MDVNCSHLRFLLPRVFPVSIIVLLPDPLCRIHDLLVSPLRQAPLEFLLVLTVFSCVWFPRVSGVFSVVTCGASNTASGRAMEAYCRVIVPSQSFTILRLAFFMNRLHDLAMASVKYEISSGWRVRGIFVLPV